MSELPQTVIPGCCSIAVQKNRDGKWCAFLFSQPLAEGQAAGINAADCMKLADAFTRTSRRLDELNSREQREMLFETGGNLE